MHSDLSFPLDHFGVTIGITKQYLQGLDYAAISETLADDPDHNYAIVPVSIGYLVLNDQNVTDLLMGRKAKVIYTRKRPTSDEDLPVLDLFLDIDSMTNYPFSESN